MQILKTVIKLIEMTTREYFDYLIDLINKGYMELVKKSIDKNKRFYLEERDLPYINDIILFFIFKRTLYKKPDIVEMNKLFENYKRDIKFYDLNMKFIKKLGSLSNDEITETLLPYWKVFNDKEFKNYKYLENDHTKRVVYCYTYESIHILQKGHYFGDEALDSVSKKRYFS